MMWIIKAKCDLCMAERILKVESEVPPYSIGEQIEKCPCDGKYVVEEIAEID
ncbi:MAG: hypothetical protein Q7V10_04135 [Methanobacteriaceae archaeon]|nr:hypothetical protein [Methanobacteriaceae archaeon]MDO9626404.1 hypothetical protein [Methanobacteriaceae archaeon]